MRCNCGTSQSTAQMFLEATHAEFGRWIQQVSLQRIDPREECSCAGMVVLMPTVSKILGRIDWVADVPSVIRKSLDQTHDSEIPTDRLVLDKDSMRLQAANDGDQGRVDVSLAPVKVSGESCDDDRDGSVAGGLAAVEMQVTVALQELDCPLERCADELVRYVVDARIEVGLKALDLMFLFGRMADKRHLILIVKPDAIAARIAG